jgi:hypothetical protein
MSINQLICFQDIPPEVQAIIASHCSTYALLNLSGVNKSASTFLANAEFFREHYFKLHPSLKPYDKLYTVLITTHPSNCWKVMCKVMDAEWGIDRHNSSIAKRVNLAFMEEAHPKIVERLTIEIEAAEAKDKEICGSGYDPRSPIDKAWKQFKKFEQEEKAAWAEWHGSWRQLNDEFSQECQEKQIQCDKGLLTKILDQFFGEAKIFISSSYEDFLQKDPEENGKISKDQFCICQKMMRGSLLIRPLSKKIDLLIEEKHSNGSKYHHLEAIRRINQDIKERHQQKLIKFLSNPVEVHLKELSDEWSFARQLEACLKSRDPLEKCRVFAKNLVDHPEQQCSVAFEKLRGLVNESDTQYGTKIWQELYHKCGRRVIEDSWAEKHFPDFLPELLDTIVSLLHDVVHKTVIARGYEKSLDSF